jgi:hypothetical protein
VNLYLYSSKKQAFFKREFLNYLPSIDSDSRMLLSINSSTFIFGIYKETVLHQNHDKSPSKYRNLKVHVPRFHRHGMQTRQFEVQNYLYNASLLLYT